MRKINALQILVFMTFWLPFAGLSVWAAGALANILPAGDWRGVAVFLAWFVLFYALSLAAYRLFLAFFPLAEGPLERGSREEFVYHVYLLFNLLLFQPLMRSFVVPVPLMRMVYLVLGARLGENTYSGGVILDPPLTRVGRDTIIGHDALVISHFMTDDELSLSAVEIGDHVTVGAKAVIMPGVRIGDHAVVGINALVTRDTQIGPGETWAGTPARCIRPSQTGVDASVESINPASQSGECQPAPAA